MTADGTAPAFSRFPDGFNACVFGASGGLGGAFVRALAAHPRVGRVYAGSRREVPPPLGPVTTFRFDLLDEPSIAAAAAGLEGPLHLAIVATGVLSDGQALRPEKTWRSLDPDALARAYAVNAIGPALIAKHLLPRLARRESAVFAALSARVASITDNRLGGWHAYRAAKAALNMLIRNCAIELAARDATAVCVALHPGTVDTALSRPFQAGVKAEALYTPEHGARALLHVIDGLTAERTGRLIAWDGADIPF